MYQSSLKQFLHLFDASIVKAKRSPDIDERVGAILSTLNREVQFHAGTRSIFG